MKTEIVVRFILYGEHYYPGAALKKLAQRHQHEFGFTVKLEEQTPREIEWIEFKGYVIETLIDTYPTQLRPSGKFVDFGTMSCEEIAVEVAKIVARRICRTTVISVEEMDEACGALITLSEEEMSKLVNQPITVPKEGRDYIH